MVLYLVGPMKGKTNSNRVAFETAALELRAAGYDVISPVEIAKALCIDLSEPLPQHHRRVLIDAECALLQNVAGGAAFLPDCQDSEGADLEIRAAAMAGMPVSRVAQWLHEARQEETT